jgi:hypothetical protein
MQQTNIVENLFQDCLVPENFLVFIRNLKISILSGFMQINYLRDYFIILSSLN